MTQNAERPHERTHSDALVFFGATGDLPTRRSSRRCRRWSKRGHLDVPVIGVAKAGWNLDQLQARARDSLEKHGGLDAAAFDKLIGAAALRRRRLRRPGDVRTRCARNSATAQRPAHYLAIPPVLFGPVVEQLARSPAAPTGARVIVEKPFGHDLASARELNAILLAQLRRDDDLPHRPLPRQAAGAEHGVLPLRQRVPRAVLEPQLRRERADHDGRGLRRAGPRRVLRPDRHDPRRDPEPSVPGAGEPGDGAAGAHATASRCATRRSRC